LKALFAIALVTVTLSAAAITVYIHSKNAPAYVGQHELGESVADWSAIEKPTNLNAEVRPDLAIAYTGTLHCFDSEFGDGMHCHGSRKLVAGQQGHTLGFDNEHFTFIDGKLVSVEFVGAGGLVDDPSQHVNWNIYRQAFTQMYGKPTDSETSSIMWKFPNAYLTGIERIEPNEYLPNHEEEAERFVFVSRDYYDAHKTVASLY